MAEINSNSRRWLVTLLVVAGVVVAGYLLMPRDKLGGPGGGGNLTWFTDDDGKTFFADVARKDVPFQRNGKEVVECAVYKNGEKGPPFVNHLIRYDAKTGVRQVKKPLAPSQTWVSFSDRGAMALSRPKNPDGSPMDAILVDPNQ